MTSRLNHAGLTLLLLAAACAAGTASVDRSAMFLSAAPTPQGRTCHAAINPVTLPAADALIDSAVVVNGVKPTAGGQPGFALFSLQFDNQGHIAAFHTIESTLTPERKSAVEQLALNRIRVQPADNPWSVRLKVTVDSTPRLQVGRSEVCPAILKSAIDIQTTTVVSGTSSRGRGRGAPTGPTSIQPPPSPQFSVLIDTVGHVLDLQLNQSSGQNDLDQRMESAIRETGFRPTLLDGFPIIAWTRWPLKER